MRKLARRRGGRGRGRRRHSALAGVGGGGSGGFGRPRRRTVLLLGGRCGRRCSDERVERGCLGRAGGGRQQRVIRLNSDILKIRTSGRRAWRGRATDLNGLGSGKPRAAPWSGGAIAALEAEADAAAAGAHAVGVRVTLGLHLLPAREACRGQENDENVRKEVPCVAGCDDGPLRRFRQGPGIS